MSREGHGVTQAIPTRRRIIICCYLYALDCQGFHRSHRWMADCGLNSLDHTLPDHYLHLGYTLASLFFLWVNAVFLVFWVCTPRHRDRLRHYNL